VTNRRSSPRTRWLAVLGVDSKADEKYTKTGGNETKLKETAAKETTQPWTYNHLGFHLYSTTSVDAAGRVCN
jgi:hypothetical protein